MKIPEEIKKKVSVDEIDLQILVKEIKEREREKGNNNNLDQHLEIDLKRSEFEYDKNNEDVINKNEIIFFDNKNIDKNIKDKNNNKMIINFDSNIININNELPKFNKTYSKRLYYNIKIYYIILFLNIFFPGIGTIIVAIGWGNTCKYKDRTKELLLRGIIQILTIIFLIGWIKAIFDAINYFE